MNQPLLTLVRPADFEQALKAPSRARSPHFAVHHVAAPPSARPRPSRAAGAEKLPTEAAPEAGASVDKLVVSGYGLWLGLVVPKRHARRAATRNLIKRQLREAMRRHRERLPSGLWVVRLRQGFDREQFSSAASDALRATVRDEVERLFAKAASR